MENNNNIGQVFKKIQHSLLNQQYGSVKHLLDQLLNNDQVINDFLVQLCQLFYVTGHEDLKDFLRKYGLQKIENFYRLDWIIKAFTPEKQLIAISERYIKFRTYMAHDFVNLGFSKQQLNVNGDDYQQKEVRATFQDIQEQLIFNLIEQSLKLKQVDIEKRREQMINFLKNCNQYCKYLQTYVNPQFGGMIIPFYHGNLQSCLIVNILEDDFICFNTAKRVPYKIVIETVDPIEMQLIQKTIELIQAPELNKIYDIEKEMKAISQMKLFHSYNIDELKKLAIKQIEIIQQPQQIMEKDVYCSKYFTTSPWGEEWNKIAQTIKNQSKYGNMKSYQIRQIIVKAGDDLRGEYLIMQMLKKIQQIFQQKSMKIYLRPYDIILTSPNSGILEFIPNTLSIDKIKRDNPQISLKDFYKVHFTDFEQSQKCFAESLAGYSLICYLFQLKDRHNGNILIDNLGHIIHIDFGFILTLSPGNIGFESAPFKLINEYVDLLGGKTGDLFLYFRTLLFLGFQTLIEHINEITCYLQLMQTSVKHNMLECLNKFNFDQFKQRFQSNLHDQDLLKFVDKLIDDSIDNTRTKLYDFFQYKTNSIFY